MFFVLTKKAMQAVGFLFAYFFNFLILGVFIRMAYQAFVEQEWGSFFFSAFLSLLMLIWLIYIFKTSPKKTENKPNTD